MGSYEPTHRSANMGSYESAYMGSYEPTHRSANMGSYESADIYTIFIAYICAYLGPNEPTNGDTFERTFD